MWDLPVESVSPTYGFKVIYKTGVNLSWLIIYRRGFRAKEVHQSSRRFLQSSGLKVDVFQMAKARQTLQKL